MKTHSTREVYLFELSTLTESVSLTMGRDPEDNSIRPRLPIRHGSCDLAALAADKADPLAEFFAACYFGPDTPSPETDISWRRIDVAWTASAEALALAAGG